MVQNAANMWPIDKQKYFLTFEDNKQKKSSLELQGLKPHNPIHSGQQHVSRFSTHFSKLVNIYQMMSIFFFGK